MDAERDVVDHLNSLGLGATAYYDVPNPRPTSLSPPQPFVVVERTGGPREDMVAERPVLDIQCWATSRRDAALLADSVQSAVFGMPDALENCFGASITSTFRDYDLDSGTPRYHVVAEVIFND